MIQTSSARPQRRVARTARDFALGLGIYTMLVAGAGYISGGTADPWTMFTSTAQASAHGFAFANFEANQATTAADLRQATVILGLAFATLTAFNLAFLRHLRRVYASPR